MSILGIGMDIVETKRIGESLERFGERFLHRVFLEGEVAYSNSMKHPHLHLAGGDQPSFMVWQQERRHDWLIRRLAQALHDRS